MALLALVCFVELQEEADSIQNIIDIFLEPAFKQLVEDGIIDSSPLWLSNINNNADHFAKQQLADHFSNSIENYKAYKKNLDKIMSEMSDVLSSINLLSFLKENTEINYIYALLGEHHICFADLLDGVELIQSEENVRFVKIPVGNRTVTMEIYAGTHGNRAHFEAMQRACKEANLIIPETPQEDEFQKIDIVVKSLLMVSFNQRNKETTRRFKPIEFDLEEAASNFDNWMKNYNHEDPPLTHSQKLVEWLYDNSGAKMVSEYEDFCQLAKKLNTIGYDIPSPPTKAEFEQKLTEYNERKDYERRPSF